jgi:glycosyltransferase involved in cell wall biosynthesis
MDRILAALHAKPHPNLDRMETLSPKDITIAITVYDRRTYINQAIRSALTQRCEQRPQVIVVEDHGPDAGLRESVIAEFGDRITYLRNQQRLGLFDNWNACLERCATTWLCILHDDDFLEPTFVEAMIELSEAAPGRALYFGQWNTVDENNTHLETPPSSAQFCWHEVPLQEWTRYNPVSFAGQLFDVALARNLGGFRASSRYTADWEMWFKLALNYGAAATNRVVANFREHHSIGRGTTTVNISGRKCAYVNMQRKRHIAWLRHKQPQIRFDRHVVCKQEPIPTRFILEYGHAFSPRMLRYNAGLLFASSAPNVRYRLIQFVAQILSWRSLRVMSWIYRFSRSRC